MAIRLGAPAWLGLIGVALMTGVLAGVDPRLAIGASLGLGFVLLSVMNLTAGLLAFTFLSFTESALPAGVASLIKAAGILLALAWLAKVATDRDGARNFLSDFPGFTYLMLAYLAWGALSITWSEDTPATILSLTRYLLNFSLVVITYTAITKRRDVEGMYYMWMAGIAFSAAYGFLHPLSETIDSGRLASPVGDPNELAAVIVAGTPLILAVAITARRSPLLRLTAVAVAALGMLSFVFTGSRGGIVALLAAMVAAMVVAGRGRRVAALACVIGVSVVGALFFSAFAPQNIRDRVAETLPGQSAVQQEGRDTIWQVGWRMAQANPVKGVGLGSFQTSSIHYVIAPGPLERTDQVIDKAQVAHNSYLQVLTEVGIMGLLMFLGLLLIPLACAARAVRNFTRSGDFELEIMSRALVVSLVGYLAADFFLSNEFSKLLWILLAMGPVLLALSRRDPSDPALATSPSLGHGHKAVHTEPQVAG